ncbi:MAG: hypothetical protein AAF481_00915 [Acidobacteriota bacterium]
MPSIVLRVFEWLSILVAVVFGVLWVLDPGGHYEPIVTLCGVLGAVVAMFLRKDGGGAGDQGVGQDGVVAVEGEGRFLLKGGPEQADKAWTILTAPFLKRYTSWHPSYSDFEPVSLDPDGKAIEFETRGTSGGRYPWRIEEWSDSRKLLRLWRGPSKNPPRNIDLLIGAIFLGLNLEFRVFPGAGSPFIEITYKERWRGQPWRSRRTWFKNGPIREIRWIFNKFPMDGRVDYVRELDRHVR